MIQIKNIMDRSGVYFKYRKTDSYLTIEVNDEHERALILEALFCYEYRHIALAKKYINVDLNNDESEPETFKILGD